MTFGITVNRAPFENAPIYKFLETRRQKIARDPNLLLKVIESPDARECFPQDKKASPLPYQVNRTRHRAIGLGPAFSLHGHILREKRESCEPDRADKAA